MRWSGRNSLRKWWRAGRIPFAENGTDRWCQNQRQVTAPATRNGGRKNRYVSLYCRRGSWYEGMKEAHKMLSLCRAGKKRLPVSGCQVGQPETTDKDQSLCIDGCDQRYVMASAGYPLDMAHSDVKFLKRLQCCVPDGFSSQ